MRSVIVKGRLRDTRRTEGTARPEGRSRIAEEIDDLLEFDGSNVRWRTRGELSAGCHEEATNFLTLNLADDIGNREKSVDEAREAFAELAVKRMMGMEPDYTQQLQFDVPEGDQGDTDESDVTETLEEDVKEAVGGTVEGQ